MKKIFISVAVFFVSLSNGFAASVFKCPPMKKNIAFSGLSLFDGNPTDNVDLAPDNANSPFPHQWTLNQTIHPWLVCRYGPDQLKLYRKKMAQKFSICETVESKKGSGIFNSIKCK